MERNSDTLPEDQILYFGQVCPPASFDILMPNRR